MIGIVAWVLMVLAIFSWIVAVISAVQVVRIAPRGKRMRAYGMLGWLKIGALRDELGERAAPHLTAYQRALTAFLLLIVAGLAVGSVAMQAGRPA